MIIIRQAEESDARQIADIYNHYISHTIITFESDIISVDEMGRRIRDKREKYDWLAAEENGFIVGYAYFGEFRTRIAYSHTVETTVYVMESEKRKGIGGSLYDRLIESAKSEGFREMIGVIALPNPESVALHQKKGFREVGVFEKIGYKFSRYIDVVFMQKSLY